MDSLVFRDTIFAKVELARLAGVFGPAEDFQTLTQWFPVHEFEDLAAAGGFLLLYTRPRTSSRLSRPDEKGAALMEEEHTLHAVVLFSSQSENEMQAEMIENRIRFTEKIMDFIRREGEDEGLEWVETVPAKSPDGLPYNYMEMVRGAFCAIFEIRFQWVGKV